MVADRLPGGHEPHSQPGRALLDRDRSTGLRWDEDGGLTIHLQSDRPGQDEEANWLPTAEDGTWFVVLRMYRPHPEVIDASWECPPLTRVA